jgi:hypothetical protein
MSWYYEGLRCICRKFGRNSTRNIENEPYLRHINQQLLSSWHAAVLSSPDSKYPRPKKNKLSSWIWDFQGRSVWTEEYTSGLLNIDALPCRGSDQPNERKEMLESAETIWSIFIPESKCRESIFQWVVQSAWDGNKKPEHRACGWANHAAHLNIETRYLSRDVILIRLGLNYRKSVSKSLLFEIARLTRHVMHLQENAFFQDCDSLRIYRPLASSKRSYQNWQFEHRNHRWSFLTALRSSCLRHPIRGFVKYRSEEKGRILIVWGFC